MRTRILALAVLFIIYL
ncbi:hypothetical protein BDFB_014984 [Asbolus verrucosus]|uniref:Uncharacterized protein n=1 Tax=Asbolus verrucosus TaxID=1661398 RepID=A0A482W5U9_ASBVE|nr:hypothetical protein BDFB_014984 [Asbolus verrucosus]